MKRGSLKTIAKRVTTFALAAMCALNLGQAQVVLAEETTTANTETLEEGTYEVPITSLVSAAPLAAVQTAFATAFGESVMLEVLEDGSMTATTNCQNMQIDLMGTVYYANVMTVSGGTINTTKVATSSLGLGSSETQEIEVPDEISFPTDLDEDGSCVLTITVDFMNNFLGQGNDYPTNVTLTLDLENAVKVVEEPEEIELTDGTYEVAVALYHATEDRASMAASCLLETAEIKVKDGITKMYLHTQPMTMMNITASILELQVADEEGNYTTASVTTASEDGTPTGFAFSLPNTETYLNVKTNSSMGSAHYSDARILVDYTTLNKISDTATFEEENSNVGNSTDNSTTTEDEGTGSLENVEDVTFTDGTYEVEVALYHATNDALSMAAVSLLEKAEIVVKDDIATMYLHTQPMTFGTITASLQELKVADLNGEYTDAVVTTSTEDGNPTGFSFVLPHKEAFLTVKVNPHVAMMGNVDIDARIYVNYATLTKVSNETTTDGNAGSSTTNETDTTSGTTDNTNLTVTKNAAVIVTGTSGWDEVTAQMTILAETGTVTVTLVDTTTVSGAALEQIKGQDKNMVVLLENGMKWTINGKNITGSNLSNIDLGVVLNTNVIPTELKNSVTTGTNNAIELSLNHDGEFGFEGTLTITVGTQYASKNVTLYYYNVATGKMEQMGTYQVKENGEVDLTFSHASDYVVVIHNEADTATSPKTGDETNTAWFMILLLAGAVVMGFAFRKKKMGN